MKRILLLYIFSLIFHLNVFAQNKEKAGPVFIDSAMAVPSNSLSKSKLVPPSTAFKLYNPRNRGINRIVPGKGLPKTEDPALQKKMGDIQGRSPILNFDAVVSRATPTDPTGVAGPDHYLNAWNSAFSIWDKEGNQIVPPASLASIGGEFSNETLGDPIVVYDEAANRYIISQFSDTPESFLIAVSRGPDPVNDGWFTYRFPTDGVLPDYPKMSVWGDGYYFTTNKNSRTADESPVIYVMERDRMLEGESARVVAFPLPGIETNGFYSPAGFNSIGNELAPRGNSPIIYMQDDAWAGVSEDHLKIWLVNVDWNNLSASTISESQELNSAAGVSPFSASFDGGSFSNLAQPGDAPDVDALQATMMYMTQYRRFDSHNSVVLNFVVDIDPTAAEHAGIRWYELRQQSDGGAWSVYQEGTFAPDSRDRFSGSIGIDVRGNIGLAYTVLDDNPSNPVFPSLRYTGRFVNDERGVMTIEEQSIIEGESPNPNTRYGDYAHLSVDAADGITFWHNGEVFRGVERVNRVGVFRIAASEPNDIGVTSLVRPVDATLGTSEEITVNIRNFGTNAQSGFEVTYSLNGGPEVTEIFEETLPSATAAQFTFEETADLSEIGETYTLNIFTSLTNDSDLENDGIEVEVSNLPPNDIGVTSIDAPITGEGLGSSEQVTVTIENFGGESQQGFPVQYQVGNNSPVNETVTELLPVGENLIYTFSQDANLGSSGRYNITARTRLEDDFDPTNDSETKSVANLDCIPEGADCSFGDGISYFELGDILNERIPCGDGYIDFISSSTELDRNEGDFTLRVQSYFAQEDFEQFSMWIDLNDNAVFEDSERLITSEVIPEANTWFEYDFSLPANAALGQHLLRIRAGDTRYDGDLNDPCDVMQYGTTHDYSVNILDSSLDIEDFILNEAELAVVTEENGVYRVIMETSFNEPLRITVHNVLGQKMVENQMVNQGDGYVYELDMSYAAKGVYLVRVGTRNVGKVTRFIVR
ncbi:T9SS type A sorting domain-containing protein [Gramella sp. GC03-9]|uniref:T9SS type A sorting domain-containing protein n=1 Tax=Christiangramia oceanisediminis TaxID=2920386 RepID=A0A9X2I1K7_9FLAO|nr:T9SS type A sorting domain-containing protein [Gramella oceanisediminis]MCP9198965.1 T9SS type A sorting domain-containing protein [Gramella oceanisediminis]